MKALIERIARAICVADGHNPNGPTCDVWVPGDPDACYPWAGYRNHARAAIEAAKEAGYLLAPAVPTEAMIAAAYDAELDIYWCYAQDGSGGQPEDVWNAMAALTPSPSEPRTVPIQRTSIDGLFGEGEG
jgi:hypothetical protein